MGSADEVAVRLLLAADRVDAHRSALSRHALVWWEGPAADGFREQVASRSATLASLADDLRYAAALVRLCGQEAVP